MRSESLNCPRCGANVERGFIMDASDSGPFQNVWVEDLPEKATFLGMPIKGVVKVRGKRCLVVDTYRCTKCGLLESYAQNPAS